MKQRLIATKFDYLMYSLISRIEQMSRKNVPTFSTYTRVYKVDIACLWMVNYV